MEALPIQPQGAHTAAQREIEQLYRAILDAWNSRDAAAFAAAFAADAQVVGFDGSQMSRATSTPRSTRF